MSTPASATPKPRVSLAATVVLYRRAPALEVYWVRRADALQFLGGFHAFPGGRLNRADHGVPVQDVTGEAAALVACAVREMFEETGVLLARGARRVPRTRRDAARRGLLADESGGGPGAGAAAVDFAAFVRDEALVIEGADFTPAGRWRSPAFQPGGFDTQFLLAEAPDGESPDVWPGELASGEWIAPEQAIARWRDNGVLLAAPALATLRALAAAPAASAAEWGAALSERPEAQGGRVPRIEVHPGFVLVPVRTPTLAPATHTNCIVIGGPEVLVVDPGSPYDEEQELLDQALDALVAGGQGTAGYDGPRRVAGVLVTHHHADHWGGAARVARRFDVPVYAHGWSAPRVGADTQLNGGETIALADEPAAPGRPARPWRIEVLHTPGHTPGHLALYDRVSGTIVAGDLVSGLSTVVVDPPEGDMAAYVASIARLAELPATLLLPGHGPPIGGPAHRLAFYLEHRAWREARILAALADGPRALGDIVPVAYADTPPASHPIAARSALAHLLKLKAEGRVEEDPGGAWLAL